jgi:hypothetical protein
MALGAKYLQSGNVHIEVVNVLFSGNESNFVHPQIGANTTGENTTGTDTNTTRKNTTGQ